MSMMLAALDQNKRGWPAFPVREDKTPFPDFGKWGDQVRGLCTHEERVRATAKWWTQYPGANPAIPCKYAGIVVIDCDPPKGDNPNDGLDEFIALAKFLEQDTSNLWDTYIVRTGRGGLHFYYQWPDGYTPKGRKLWQCTNVDIRGNGGDDGNYVLAAGSETIYGPYSVENNRDPAPCPPWLGQVLIKPPDEPTPMRPPGDPFFELLEDRSMQGLLDYLAEVPPGDQDNRMNSITWQLRRDGFTEEEVREGLLRTIPRMQIDGDPWTEKDVERHLRKFF